MKFQNSKTTIPVKEIIQNTHFRINYGNTNSPENCLLCPESKMVISNIYVVYDSGRLKKLTLEIVLLELCPGVIHQI